MFRQRGAICQSCGMPLARDAKGGGTNADGSRTLLYCSHCYQNGQFTQPDFTAEEMQTFVFDRLRSIRVPKFLATHFTRDIPKLKRWKTD